MEGKISKEDFKQCISKFDPESVHWVDVTHIINPSNFYVRLSADACILRKINRIPRDQLKKPDCICIGDLLFYESNKRENKLMRGEIKKITKLENSSTVYSIYAIDFGFYDKEITVDNIWQCSYNNLPPLAHLCELYQCLPNTIDGKWSQKSIEAMVIFVGSTQVKMIIKQKTLRGKLLVQINNHPCDVGTMLILANCASLEYAPPTRACRCEFLRPFPVLNAIEDAELPEDPMLEQYLRLIELQAMGRHEVFLRLTEHTKLLKNNTQIMVLNGPLFTEIGLQCNEAEISQVGNFIENNITTNIYCIEKL